MAIFGLKSKVPQNGPKIPKQVQKIGLTIQVPYILSYFGIKIQLFDVDLLPRTFDLESPKSRNSKKSHLACHNMT